MEVITASTEETKQFAQELAKTLKPGDVLALYGDLGSGKTTFTNFLVVAMGIESRVQSPTFVIMRSYSGGSGEITKINHVDLYRLTTLEEVQDLGIEELLDDPKAVTVIEWPELAEDVLPAGTKKIYFEYVDENSRKISINV